MGRISMQLRMGQADVGSSGYLDQCDTKDESVGFLHEGIYGDHLCITWYTQGCRKEQVHL